MRRSTTFGPSRLPGVGPADRDLVGQGPQFIVATHSPILLAVPNARILQVDIDGTIEQADYDAAEPVTLTRGFLADPGSVPAPSLHRRH